MEQEPEPTTYQVFINYRSVDTKNTLASLIYHSLTNRGLRVFLYHKKLCTEDGFRSVIRGAISSASVHITIFSEHYAESRFCLDELCSILRSSHERRILPVFSNVEPGELRQIERGCYAQDFRNHESRFTIEEVEGWKAALRKAADISGFVLKTNECDHGRFLENIVNDVWRMVKREPLQIEKYQVFINHRGPDAKLTHASLIYHRLRHCGLRVFLDGKELRGGSTLEDAIQGAISSASIHIVIFSKKYAESRWCLDELCWILRSSHERNTTIIPMFCDVEPRDLRDIEGGHYAEAFRSHQQNGGVVPEWKEALEEAADISGYIVKTNGSDYGMYLEQILSIILTKVKQGEPLEVATHPVGLDEAAKDFQNEIVNLSNTKIVGITGMGGLGKSTLAKHLYNLKRFDFTRSCFLFNVRGRGLPSLQKQLIRDLLGHDLDIDNTIQGKVILQRSLQELRTLIILDDVDHIQQIHSLLDMDAVGPRSLILLTSRDKDLLRRCPKALSYDVKPLNRQNAQELFCRHAFNLSEPVQGFEDLVKEFLEICGGLPSSLRAFGQHLAGNGDKAYWKLQVEKFSKRLPADTLNTLKVSYEALKKVQKEMFLDIGCFLVGEDRELVVQVLEGLGYSYVRDCLESLHQKCLVEYNYYDVETSNYIKYNDEHPEFCRLIMHNQVKLLARHIAREEFFEFAKHKPLRLSCSSDLTEIFQLQDGSKSCLTRGIRIAKDQNPPQFTDQIKIRGVRLLVVDQHIDLSSLSGDLIWLHLNDFPSISIPSTISLARLRVLELHGTDDHLQQSFDRFNELPYELLELNSDVGIATSASASSSHELFDVEHYMNFCRNISAAQQGANTSAFSGFSKWIGTLMNKTVFKYFTTVQSFPIHFGELKNLRHLDLSRCINLTELPNSFSELLHLQYLALQYCINLSIQTDILGEISTLEYVDFRGCAKLIHLPEGMAKQRSLKYLNLKFCFELKTLPDLSSFVNLKFLNINGCVKLETLNNEGPKINGRISL